MDKVKVAVSMEPRADTATEDVQEIEQESSANKNPCVQTQFHLGYRPALDGMRAVAILSVMAFHAQMPFSKIGTLGVDIFFVLSGFLITTLLLQEWQQTGAIALRYFYLRRMLRLLPALYVLLFVWSIYIVVFMNPADAGADWNGVGYSLLYIANWATANGISLGALGHTWSLGIEEQFYLLWPPILVVCLTKRFSQKAIGGLVIALIGGAAIIRAVIWTNSHFFPRVYNGLDTRIDSLLVGCFTALILSWNWLPYFQQRKWWAGVLLGPALILGSYTATTWDRDGAYTFLSYGGFTVVAIGIALVILLLMQGRTSRLHMVLELPPLVWIGKISYSLYLWHFVIFSVVYYIGFPVLIKYGLDFGVSFACAAASFYLVEQPILRLKSRLKATGTSVADRATLARDRPTGPLGGRAP